MSVLSSDAEPKPQQNLHSWLDRPLIPQVPAITIETLIVTLILALTIFSRFYILGDRVMSHDETNHVVPSYDLYQGRGYRHDPITHGPFQFHIIALTYFMFGDSDFTSRIPAALFSVATVLFTWWGYRRYLGRTGAIVASVMMMISPYMLFYGRYTRNEAFVGLSGVVMLYAILRYLETARPRFLFLLTLTTVFHVIVKETSYIYIAQALIFLGLIFMMRIMGRAWKVPAYKRTFLIALGIAVILVGAALAAHSAANPIQAAPVAAGQSPAATLPAQTTTGAPAKVVPIALGGLGVLALAGALYFLFTGAGFSLIRSERSFDLLLLLGTLVLPLLSPFPVSWAGWDPTDYSSTGIIHTSVMIVPLVLAAILIGLWWQPRLWLANAALFYAVFIVFYTTFFTNGSGFLTGLVGALGYWVKQQAVNRGTQPWYFFALLQVPIYEFLPAIGTILAFLLALRKPWMTTLPAFPAETTIAQEPLPEEEAVMGAGDSDGRITDSLYEEDGEGEYPIEADKPILADEPELFHRMFPPRVPFVFLFIYWSVISLIAFSIAGEKMPWLTVHITWPMILSSGWVFGYLLDTTPWSRLREKRGFLAVLLLPVFLFSVSAAIGSLLGANPPFQGNELVQLQNTTTFLTSIVVAILSGVGLLNLLQNWSGFEVSRAVGVVVLAVLAILTARAAIRASFINYDNAKEYLVYAHAARGPKDVLNDVTEISQRTTGGLDVAVAYDDETLYPYWWYFRNFPKKFWYADKPTRDLRNYPIVIVGDKNYSKVEPILGKGYTYYEVMRLWWPNEDYKNLTFERIKYALTNPGMRAALWQIWFNRDYTLYGQLTNNSNLTLTTWSPSNKLRIYIRNDIVSQIWKYGAAPVTPPSEVDPYAKGTITLEADQVIGAAGTENGLFNAPRGVAVAPDGSVYVADSRNNRIQHFSADGTMIQAWGSFADIAKGEAPGGTFYEPWGVAVSPDGKFVYVADTWNNRIQKFTSDGQFIKMWGYFGQAEKPEAFWGPRGLAVNAAGQVLVTDTGNKRVVVFDAEGNYVTQFGGEGANPGEMDEPVGIAVNASGEVYIADTWNSRIQAFAPDASGITYTPKLQWDVSAWVGTSVENKPFLTVDKAGNVFVTDPEGYRVLEFTASGSFIRAWGDYGTESSAFGLASGVAADLDGGVWVTDGGNSRLMHFTLPQ